MRVGEVMNRRVISIEPASTLREAGRLMKEYDIGFLVVSNRGQVLGVLTDRDMVVRGLAAGAEPLTARADEAMTHGVFWCREDDDLDEAVRAMGEKKVRRLLVLDAEDRPVGVISLGDVAARCGAGESFCGALAALCREVAGRRPEW